MGFRNSQINIVLAAIDHLEITPEDAATIPYNELKEKLVDYDVPDAVWVELWAEGSGKKPRIRNIVHTKPISKQRFFAMMKQVHSMDELKER
jgi:hypothetical protein